MNFEVENAHGRLCCRSDKFEHLCDKCKATVLATPPDPYAPGLAALRAAAQPAPATHDDVDAQLKSTSDFRSDVYSLSLEAMPRTTFEPQSRSVYANPPDPYEHALKALREARR